MVWPLSDMRGDVKFLLPFWLLRVDFDTKKPVTQQMFSVGVCGRASLSFVSDMRCILCSTVCLCMFYTDWGGRGVGWVRGGKN